MESEKEESINSKLIKRIKYLEYLNSSLIQTNKLLSSKLECLTKKYNDLKNELYDTECHINFCKQNLVELISFKKEEDKEKKDKNFVIFKNKIKTLFKYGDDFMKTDSEIIIFNMIIDNIENIQEENISLRKNLEELKKIIYQNNDNNNNGINDNYTNNYIPSPILYRNYNNSLTTVEKNEYQNNDAPFIDNYNFNEQNSELDDDLLIYQNNYKNKHYNHKLNHKYI